MTTICAVKKDNQLAMAGDGQITMGQQVIMKGSARKIRRIVVTKRDPRRQRIQGQDERAAPQDKNPPKRPARPHRSPSRTRIQLPPSSLSAARGENSRRTASMKGVTCL